MELLELVSQSSGWQASWLQGLFSLQTGGAIMSLLQDKNTIIKK
jgi:hypothetical protein